jgi:hypothetical protein
VSGFSSHPSIFLSPDVRILIGAAEPYPQRPICTLAVRKKQLSGFPSALFAPGTSPRQSFLTKCPAFDRCDLTVAERHERQTSSL